MKVTLSKSPHGETLTEHNENDGPGRCSCWLHRRRRLAVYGAPYDEFQGTDADLVEFLEREGRKVLV